MTTVYVLSSEPDIVTAVPFEDIMIVMDVTSVPLYVAAEAVEVVRIADVVVKTDFECDEEDIATDEEMAIVVAATEVNDSLVEAETDGFGDDDTVPAEGGDSEGDEMKVAVDTKLSEIVVLSIVEYTDAELTGTMVAAVVATTVVCPAVFVCVATVDTTAVEYLAQ